MLTVVKIGGSLFPEHTDKLCECLIKSDEKIVLINGGGDFANKLREYHEKYNFSNDIMHWSAIKSMDIIGELIASRNKNIQCINNPEDIEKVHDNKKIPLLLSYDLLKKEDPLKHSWDVTSDSIA
ncbi:MAG: delta 1-pyrroline-5-carboxylate synthetase, partial [Methanosphaera sp.]|nr:delta 1-pyrroline-5-carboxylate synthetase [Methanosphaera sp.]